MGLPQRTHPPHDATPCPLHVSVHSKGTLFSLCSLCSHSDLTLFSPFSLRAELCVCCSASRRRSFRKVKNALKAQARVRQARRVVIKHTAKRLRDECWAVEWAAARTQHARAAPDARRHVRAALWATSATTWRRRKEPASARGRKRAAPARGVGRAASQPRTSRDGGWVLGGSRTGRPRRTGGEIIVHR
jgi:hypothetical protein